VAVDPAVTRKDGRQRRPADTSAQRDGRLASGGMLGYVEDQITPLPVRGTSLPFCPFPTNSNTPIKIAYNAVETID
jgi:hypothetical protein